MKYISLSIRNKTYKLSENDIKRIHLKMKKERPLLPSYQERISKLVSPAITNVDFEIFS